jgi:imidazolonepropionase
MFTIFVSQIIKAIQMKILIKNIKEIIEIDDKSRLKVSGNEMKELHTMEDAYLITDGEWIASYGLMENLEQDSHYKDITETIDATGKMLFPSFVDSHTHLVYAGSREIEYGDKIRGLSQWNRHVITQICKCLTVTIAV